MVPLPRGSEILRRNPGTDTLFTTENRITDHLSSLEGAVEGIKYR